MSSTAPLSTSYRKAADQRAFSNGIWFAVTFAIFSMLPVSGAESKPPRPGPWNLPELFATPKVTWGSTNGLVQELYYQGEPFQGKPTRIHSYLGRPVAAGAADFPAMVLVHGGGGKAFKEWAAHWAKHGYVALAMDLSGNGPDGRLPDGGPDQSDESKFHNFTEDEVDGMWTYHAVAAVIRGHSLLRSLPFVDPDRTGLTGISWGGYLTCIVAGIDGRFKVAVPVYGCGHLGENSFWTDKSLAAMNPAARALWLRLFDPGQYVDQVGYPILFVNGTTDFAYPLDSYQKTYRQVPGRWRFVSVAVNRPHGHIWTFPEVDAFVDSVLKGAPKLVRIGKISEHNGVVSTTVDRESGFKELQLCYTTDSGPWQKRKWVVAPAEIRNGTLQAALPPDRPLTAFLAAVDEAGCHVSSEHLELPAP